MLIAFCLPTCSEQMELRKIVAEDKRQPAGWQGQPANRIQATEWLANSMLHNLLLILA